MHFFQGVYHSTGFAVPENFFLDYASISTKILNLLSDQYMKACHNIYLYCPLKNCQGRLQPIPNHYSAALRHMLFNLYIEKNEDIIIQMSIANLHQ